jgi:hypothetical protein
MIEGLPFYVNLLFILTVLFTFWLFSKIIRNRTVQLLLTFWLLITGVLAFNKFFAAFDSKPPRFFLVVIIPLITIIFSLINPRTSAFINKLSLRKLVILSIVRIPVEGVLYLLFLYAQIPRLMVFTGRNFDILAGLSAPIIYFICFRGEQVRKRTILMIWHVIALALLLNIVVNALFSAPFSFQQFGFEQPNKAVFYFPFIWLPGFIVMAVLFSHFVSIKALIVRRRFQNRTDESSIQLQK